MHYIYTFSAHQETFSGNERKTSNLRKKSLLSLIYDLSFCAINLSYHSKKADMVLIKYSGLDLTVNREPFVYPSKYIKSSKLWIVNQKMI